MPSSVHLIVCALKKCILREYHCLSCRLRRRGDFYPETMPTKEWFPFYSWPTIASLNAWLRNVENTSFVYIVKVCELITHVKRFENVKNLKPMLFAY